MTAGPYAIQFTSSADKELNALPRKGQARVLRAIMALADDPRPYGCRKLTGRDDAYRIRVGVYRVVYVIEDDKLVVLVVRVGHRKDVYRRK